MGSVTIPLPEGVDPVEVKMLITIVLFEKGILSSGQAADFLGLSRKQFLEAVGKYGISIFGETAEDIKRVEAKSF